MRIVQHHNTTRIEIEAEFQPESQVVAEHEAQGEPQFEEHIDIYDEADSEEQQADPIEQEFGFELSEDDMNLDGEAINLGLEGFADKRKMPMPEYSGDDGSDYDIDAEIAGWILYQKRMPKLPVLSSL